MSQMTSRERVLTTINHKEPDRVPFDCPLAFHAFTRLMDYLGIGETKRVIPSNPDLSVHPPVDFLEAMNIDLIYIGLGNGHDEYPFELGMDWYTDEWGIQYRKLESPYGISYEAINHPLAKATINDLRHFPWPDPTDPARIHGLKQKCEYLFQNTQLAIVGRFNTSIFEQAFSLRGFEQFLMDLAINQDFACALLDKTTEIAIGMIDAGMKACGKYIQILRLAGDDMGHQSGTLLSPNTFRRIIKPRFAQLYTYAKTLFVRYNPDGKLMAHTDGDVYSLIPDYIEMGLDVLNPVQPGVSHMDPKILKSEFGDRLSFHGAVDIQHLLPFGNPAEVRSELIKIVRTLGPGGGYILAPTHYLQADVPPENILALRDAVLKFGTYPLAEMV